MDLSLEYCVKLVVVHLIKCKMIVDFFACLLENFVIVFRFCSLLFQKSGLFFVSKAFTLTMLKFVFIVLLGWILYTYLIS